MLRHLNIRPAAALAAVTLLGAPLPVRALDSTCRRANEPAEDSSARLLRDNSFRDNSFRDKASRFAPRLEIRVWFEPSDDRQAREQARPSALIAAPTPTPRPTQRQAQARRPHGWQVSVRWDLVEMAEAIDPDLATSAARPTPTECLESQTLVRRLILEDERLEAAYPQADSTANKGEQ